VAFGNLLQGVPFHFDNNLVSTYEGSFWGLLNPFALLCGVVSSAMITFHGGVYLAHRTEGAIQQRAQRWVGVCGLIWLAGLPWPASGWHWGLMAMSLPRRCSRMRCRTRWPKPSVVPPGPGWAITSAGR
jgi:cytochrome d ubiquinol oxidase subunit II